MSIVGARPQFIKLGPLSKVIRKVYHEVIVHTGQHFDMVMSQLFFDELDISEPGYYLGINGGNHGDQTGRMLIELERVVISEKPDVIIVFGDTNSTLAGALVAAKLQIPSIHVEAGLRSYNRSMPEEINRIVADHTADFLFAPTETAFKNLAIEGLEKKTVQTGDIMVDALKDNMPKAMSKSRILSEISVSPEEYYILTLHRPYNVDDPVKLGSILNNLKGCKYPIIFPVHPRTRKNINEKYLVNWENFSFIEPLGYLDFLMLLANSRKIITDSGGIQKEAYILKKPCITLRPETEWIETTKDGWNLLLDGEKSGICKVIDDFHPQKRQSNVFGENVADRMIEEIIKFMK